MENRREKKVSGGFGSTQERQTKQGKGRTALYHDELPFVVGGQIDGGFGQAFLQVVDAGQDSIKVGIQSRLCNPRSVLQRSQDGFLVALEVVEEGGGSALEVEGHWAFGVRGRRSQARDSRYK